MASQSISGHLEHEARFFSIENHRQQTYILAGWDVADGKASPSLFPTPPKNARLLYSDGWSNRILDLKSGDWYPHLDAVLESK